MYKISEEDSQDEEVLNSLNASLSTKLAVSGSGDRPKPPPPPRAKPAVPAKPAFLRKPNGSTSTNANYQSLPAVAELQNIHVAASEYPPPLPPMKEESVVTIPIPSSQCSNNNNTPVPNSSQLSAPEALAGTLVISCPNQDQNVTWTSSSPSESANSDREDRDCSSSESNNTDIPRSTSHKNTVKTKRKRRRVYKETVELEESDNDGSHAADDESCSSCSTGSGSSSYSEYGYECSSYSSSMDQESHSGSEFGSEIDYALDDDVATLVSESDIESWTRGIRDLFICEYSSGRNCSDMLEFAREGGKFKGQGNKHRSIHPFKEATELLEPREEEGGSKGKVSRLLHIKGPREKSFPDLDSKPDVASTGPKKEPSKSSNIRKPKAHKVFRFKDEHEGEIRRVDLLVTSYSKHNLGRRATMVESFLGVIPSTFSSTSTGANDKSVPTVKKRTKDKRIMVAGFIPDGAGARDKQIKIGDWLQKVNGISVDFTNVDSVLLDVVHQNSQDWKTNPIKITLQLQRVSGYTITDQPVKSVKFEDEIGEISTNGKEEKSSQEQVTINLNPNLNKVAMVFIPVPVLSSALSSQQSSKDNEKDVLFTWPKEEESTKVKAIVASHGMFVTLHQVMMDITGSHPVSSRVMIDEDETDVVYFSDDDGKGLLLVAAPTSLCNFQACLPPAPNFRQGKKLRWIPPFNGGPTLAYRLMTRVVILLNHQFGSLSRAFSQISEQELSEFIIKTLSDFGEISEDFLFPQVPEYFLRIPFKTRFHIDEKLYLLDTSDTLNLSRGKTLGEKPLLNCLGSCLYYKGMTVSNHMESKLASLFHGWWRSQLGLWGLKRNTISSSWEPLKRLIIWKESFIYNSQEGDEIEGDHIERKDQPTTACYSLLVGIGDYILGLVLEPANPLDRITKPDIEWILRGFNCLLRILKSDIDPSLSKWISSQEKEFIELHPVQGSMTKPSSSTVSLNKVPKLPAMISATTTTSTGPSGILKNAEIVGSRSTSVPIDLDGTAENSNSGNLDTLSRHLQSSRDYSYHYGIPSSATSVEHLGTMYGTNEEDEHEDSTTATGSDTSSMRWNPEEPLPPDEVAADDEIQTVSITKGNVLFDFLQIEYGRSVLLSTKDDVEGPFSVILHNFKQSASLVHNSLHKAASGRVRLWGQSSDRKWVSKALTPICEQGILFNCDIVDPRDVHKKKPRLRQLSYWVIGRIYPNQRELYVCYLDGPIPQNLLEVAFKLAYYSS